MGLAKRIKADLEETSSMRGVPAWEKPILRKKRKIAISVGKKLGLIK